MRLKYRWTIQGATWLLLGVVWTCLANVGCGQEGTPPPSEMMAGVGGEVGTGGASAPSGTGGAIVTNPGTGGSDVPGTGGSIPMGMGGATAPPGTGGMAMGVGGMIVMPVDGGVDIGTPIGVLDVYSFEGGYLQIPAKTVCPRSSINTQGKPSGLPNETTGLCVFLLMSATRCAMTDMGVTIMPDPSAPPANIDWNAFGSSASALVTAANIAVSRTSSETLSVTPAGPTIAEPLRMLCGMSSPTGQGEMGIVRLALQAAGVSQSPPQ